MSENREYVSRPDEMGNIHISEDVLAVMAAAAALEVEGVGSLSPNLGGDLVEMLGGRKNIAKGVHVGMNEDGSVNVDVAILIKYGYTVLEVAKQVQDAVFAAIENMSGLTPACVNVSVSGVTFDKDAKRPQL
ncbi:MAG: Asp23/Gls24 family envelope stress response protein [Pseudoflavonifractor sp.]